MAAKTKATPNPQVDDFGLPVGVVLFSEEQVATMFSLTKRQLRRYRTGVDPVLPAFRPSGPTSPPMYRRADLIAWLSR
ncbi:helix-turn-helix domain-containing protein [Nocardioides antri]|uniref:Helix-turn-helix domain-containing protein n=1 Tax=Nocardioides antri TaxID=2607659 RepID=A0A5B1LRP6_9ACTN|nr:helix-turn-helix domain-containing protein [Nocardioides antri]KAA1423186.1 helix-turn-helix domain-containing protein [Nocardioides antri]